MRERLDCAVLLTDCTIGWVEPLLGQHAGGRLHLHPLEHVVRVEDDASAHALAGSSMALRRFDVCVIPVWPASLSWARMSLAQGAGKLHTPVLALAHELSTAGLYDLHQLGVADFLRTPFCSHEARMRIERLLDGRRATLPPLPAPGLHVSEARPAGEDPFSRPLAPGNTPEQGASVWDLDGYAVAAASCSSSSSESFQEAKKRVIERFERAYINAALGRHGGNIAMAARAAKKHRRAFWALMRKHEIDAEPYRRRSCPLPARRQSLGSSNQSSHASGTSTGGSAWA